ncbi:MAG: hypothetical protein ACMVO5_04415 [Polymorphobacter sp.]|uniref:hypothetical protein n=1 Tax=Polymorphobacter sp. TaxID=1909290 RepID=UPI003A89613B
MTSAATLRRLALAMLVVAIVTGVGSLVALMLGWFSTPLAALVSTVFLVLGLTIDRVAARREASQMPSQSQGE